MRPNFKKKSTALAMVAILLLSTVSYLIWNNLYIGINSKTLLLKSVDQYSDLITVGLAERAFDQMLTPDSKARSITKIEKIRHEIPVSKEECPNSPSVLNGTNRLKLWEKPDCVFGYKVTTEEKEVTIPNSETFKAYSIDRKNNWTNLNIREIVIDGDRADLSYSYTTKAGGDYTTDETWYRSGNKWLRDF